MGVRLAIGASTRRVREMLLFESLAPIVLGTLVGVVVAIIGCRFLGYLVENSAQPALWTCLYAAALLLCAGAFAAWRATAKVLSIAPIEALRAE